MNNKQQHPHDEENNALQHLETLLKLKDMSFLDKFKIAEKGLSKDEALQTIDHFQLEADELSWLGMISKSLLQLPDGNTSVGKEERDRILAFAVIWSIGLEALGSPQAFLQWLRKPNESLGDYVPIKIMDTIIGLEEVKKELRRVEHSIT